jgi:uncharacterized membrane protein
MVRDAPNIRGVRIPKCFRALTRARPAPDNEATFQRNQSTTLKENEDMNATHLHLMLNHIPVLGTAFGLGLLAFALWRKSEELKNAALGVFLITALFSVPVYLTGEPAEDLVEPLAGVSKAIIEQHEEAAVVAFIGLLVLGVVALAGLILSRRNKIVPAWFGMVMLASSLIVSGLMAWTANLGGQIRHTEIRSGANPPAVQSVKEYH